MASTPTSNRASHVVSTQITGGTIDWTIPKFSRLVDYLAGKSEFRSASSLSTIDSCVWYLSLTSIGANGRERIVFNLCREITDSKNPECLCYGKLCFRWKFSLLDERDRIIYFEGSDDFTDDAAFKTHEILVNYGGPVVYLSLPGEFVWSPKDDQIPLLQHDTLNMRVQFEYVYSATSIQCTVAEPQSDTSELDREPAEDFSHLLHLKEGQDFTLVSNDGKQFAVHRKILQARSDYFAAMLSSDVKEVKSGRCVLPDIDGKTLQVLIAYMYSGVPKVPEDLVQSLLGTADKYQFTVLKEYCETRLISRLMLGCAAHFLVLADRHSALKLRDACLEMIKGGYAVFRDTGGVDFMRKNGNPELLTVMRAAVRS
ncbi:hypothetical protein RvY_18720 [Ramazzottius varieornatus]|uniref:BTB domain-containing protein n=1 Tax=Ramazzottius varieornatus TaxID=947166 RepID=A0A1D1W718_RAMVA|nr:hypothetical protein RvY_18720 [Ramazzottius varieornatus]